MLWGGQKRDRSLVAEPEDLAANARLSHVWHSEACIESAGRVVRCGYEVTGRLTVIERFGEPPVAFAKPYPRRGGRPDDPR
jgi:hypothetical protein